VHQPLVVRQVGGGRVQALGLGAFLGDPVRVQGVCRLQELVPRLRDQGQGRGDRDVGQDVGRILEPEAVLDQPVFPRLGDQVLEDLLMGLGPQPRAEVGQETGVGQRTMQAEVEEEPEGHVDLALSENLAVGEAVLELEELQFQEQHRLQWRPPHGGIVMGQEDRAKPLEIHGVADAAQVMVVRDDGVEDLAIQFGEGDVPRFSLQHGWLPCDPARERVFS
jgi:hypothetical protein